MFQDDVLLKSATVEAGRGKSRVRYLADLSTSRRPTAADMEAASKILRVLNDHYPGHDWMIEVDATEGWAKIGILMLLGPNWTMFLKFEDWTEARVMKLGGEILERFKIKRGWIDPVGYADAAAKNPLMGMYRARDAKRIPV